MKPVAQTISATQPTVGGSGLVATIGEPEKRILQRGLNILESLSRNGPDQTIGSICGSTRLPPATVHRILAALIEWGAVERVARGRYRLGLKLWHLGATVPQARELRDVALPFMEDLYEATHEVVHLAVRDGYDLLYIEKLSGRQSVRATSSVGGRLPLHATGPGKVLLAFAEHGFLDEIIERGLVRRTHHTITDPTELRTVLAVVRRSGVAVSRSEASEGTASVAAPVFSRHDQIIASVSVVVPERRLNEAALVPLVRTVARAITRQTAHAH